MKYDFDLDMDSDNSLSMILQGIKNNSTVLEFGPAMGRMTRYLKEKLSCRVMIVEYDREAFQSAIHYAEDGFCGDADTLEWRERFGAYKFDYIIFADVLEHLRNPQKVLNAALDLLAEEGQIAMSVPNIGHNSILIDLYNGKFDYRDVGLLDNTHIHFFTYHSLKNMIDICGLETVSEDATLAECEYTEFGNSLFALPPEIRYAMKQRDYAYVYQFIFFCRKKAAVSDEEEVFPSVSRIVKKHGETMSVFLDYGEGYREDTKISRPVHEGENHYSFTVERPEALRNFRIDFVEAPCCVRLISLRVDGQEIDRAKLKTNCSWYDSNEYEFITIDPQMEFETNGFMGRVEAVFDLEMLTLDVLGRLAAKKNEKMKWEQERHQAQIQKIYKSGFWMLVRLSRFLVRGLKKIGRVLIPRRVRKGLFIIRHEGFSVFFEKLSVYRKRKYAEWKFVRNGLYPSEELLLEQRGHIFDREVCFSIIVPLYNTPKKYLVEMIKSCQNQTYVNWELCLADGSDREHAYVGKVVRAMATKDSRIKYRVLENNGGISENTNAALEMAAGDYIALLDHDDILHPSALYEYMKAICEQGADFIYCDEMTFQGKLSHIISLHFKPDFAIDNLRANNYICHFSVFSKELLKRSGNFRKEFDGSQDHDMILRLTEQADKIVHVPEILYFWRSHPASVASDISSKPYAVDAGKRAVLSHLERCGLRGSVESSWAFPTIFNIKYELRGNAKISVIIPNKDNVEMLSRCIESITKKSTYNNYEILIVENNSTEELTFQCYDTLASHPGVRVIHYKEKGFHYARINNYAVEYAAGEYVLFLNNDIEIITPEWMEEMLMFAQREDVGAVGAKLYYPDHTIQNAGIVLGMGADRCAGTPHQHVTYDNPGYMGRLCYAQNFSAVTAACMLVSKEIFQSVGGFDERFAVAYNDVDLCLKIAEAGYRNVWTPCAEAYHYESVSRGYESTPEKQERFQREVRLFREKWGQQIDLGDPYYNKNFSLDSSDFTPRME